MANLPRRSLRKLKELLIVFLFLLLNPASLSSNSTNKNNDVDISNNNDMKNSNKQENTEFNPVEMYAGKNMGISLVHDDNGEKFYSTFFHTDTEAGTQLTRWKTRAFDSWTKIIVGNSTKKDVFNMTFTYKNSDTTTKTKEVEMRVHINEDGTVSLSCENNNKFMAWGWKKKTEKENSFYEEGNEKNFNVVKIDDYEELKNIAPPFCVEDGICLSCRYTLTDGSITPIKIRILNVSFADKDNVASIETNPTIPDDVVTESFVANYGPTPVTKELSVSYTKTESDETNWSESWGFEKSTSLEASATLGSLVSVKASATRKVSYDGQTGGGNTITDTETMDDRLTVECPPRSKCFLKYVAQKSEEKGINFTALVEMTSDQGKVMMNKSGTWTGVREFSFVTIFCTEDIDTGESNCPVSNNPTAMGLKSSTKTSFKASALCFVLCFAFSF